MSAPTGTFIKFVLTYNLYMFVLVLQPKRLANTVRRYSITNTLQHYSYTTKHPATGAGCFI